MKSGYVEEKVMNQLVTPYMGVWIEMERLLKSWEIACVTPYMGVWIEIASTNNRLRGITKSLPAWECGLKLNLSCSSPSLTMVTPRMGVWIEICIIDKFKEGDYSHSPHGSVD